MVICKIGIVNVQLVKSKFTTRKHYHPNFSTCKFIILKLSICEKQPAIRKIKLSNFQFVK